MEKNRCGYLLQPWHEHSLSGSMPHVRLILSQEVLKRTFCTVCGRLKMLKAFNWKVIFHYVCCTTTRNVSIKNKITNKVARIVSYSQTLIIRVTYSHVCPFFASYDELQIKTLNTGAMELMNGPSCSCERSELLLFTTPDLCHGSLTLTLHKSYVPPVCLLTVCVWGFIFSMRFRTAGSQTHFYKHVHIH